MTGAALADTTRVARRLDCLLVTDYPAPWREKVYQAVHEQLGDGFHVLYCTKREGHRQWSFPLGTHPKTFLRTLTIRAGKKERHISFGIIPFILRHRPKALIAFSFNPTVLLALVAGRLVGSKLIIFSDTWLDRDRDIGRIQRLVRRVVYTGFADAFLGASLQTLRMFKHYRPGIPDDRLFLSALCADNDYFRRTLKLTLVERRYDLLFCGRISPEKNPLFFADVAIGLKQRKGRCRVLVVGDGEPSLRDAMLDNMRQGGVDVEYAGFVTHADLPRHYAQARVFLFPTSMDCWGVVLNEAMVSGLPVITTACTAAAGELVVDGQNGYVLPLHLETWINAVELLLRDHEEWKMLSAHAEAAAGRFSFEVAADGIIASIQKVLAPDSLRTATRPTHAPITRSSNAD
jgi:glycosyltransferase involved in cell wall biosynthesis